MKPPPEGSGLRHGRAFWGAEGRGGGATWRISATPFRTPRIEVSAGRLPVSFGWTPSASLRAGEPPGHTGDRDGILLVQLVSECRQEDDPDDDPEDMAPLRGT